MSGRLLIPVLIVVTLVLGLISLGIGTLGLDYAGWLGGETTGSARLTGVVITEIRLPRMLLGLLTGAILGLSGAVLQGLLRNPLAEPGLLGISGGASLGAVIAIYYGLAAVAPLAAPLAGLAGAMAAGFAALLLARGGGTLALILAGAAISSLAGAGISLALNLAPNPYAAYEIMTWLMGSLANRGWEEITLAAPLIVIGGAALLATARSLDALALGEVQAESLGVDVGRTRLLALAGTGLGVGAATAVVGTIGFVGLVAPHLVRPFVGHRPGATLVPAALAGAALLTAADIGTRLIRLDSPIHLGVFTALVGAPFFLWLVLRMREPNAMTALTLEAIRLKRGGRLVLDDVSASFAAGRLTAVIGPNGAGKSSLLEVAAGLLKPEHGEVLIGGTPLPTLRRQELARRRAYLPQRVGVDWPISVERVVALGLLPQLPAFGGLPAALLPAIDRALAECDLITLRERPATDLSGGELARVLLARAIVGDPELLIVDEPTADLDPRHAIDAMRRLRARADAGRTVVMAIHDIDLAFRFADHVVAVREGNILAAGRAEDVMRDQILSELYDVRVRIVRDEYGATIRFLD